jgi:hypothetical protein
MECDFNNQIRNFSYSDTQNSDFPTCILFYEKGEFKRGDSADYKLIRTKSEEQFFCRYFKIYSAPSKWENYENAQVIIDSREISAKYEFPGFSGTASMLGDKLVHDNLPGYSGIKKKIKIEIDESEYSNYFLDYYQVSSGFTCDSVAVNYFPLDNSVTPSVKQKFVYQTDKNGFPVLKNWTEWDRAMAKFEDRKDTFCKTNHFPWFLVSGGTCVYDWEFF